MATAPDPAIPTIAHRAKVTFEVPPAASSVRISSAPILDVPPAPPPERAGSGPIKAPRPAPGRGRPAVFALALALLLLAGIAFRIYLLHRFYTIPDADQTILALMARHVQHGELPVFYWGQPYTGAGDAYLGAALFALFGQHDALIHVPALLGSIAFVALSCALAWRLYGSGIAIICALYLGIAPTLLIDWGFWAGSGYLETMALGIGALLLALPPPDPFTPSRPWRRLPAAFLLLGLGLWVQPVAAYYLLAVFVLLAGRIAAAARLPRRWPAGLALSLACCAALAVGAAPLLIFNLQHDAATLAFLTERASGLAPATVLARALLWAAPVLLGPMPPTTDTGYFDRFILDHYPLYGAALVLVLALLARGLSLWRAVLRRLRTLLTANTAPDAALLVLGLALLAGYLTSSWGAERWSGSQPRYLLPIYSLTPLVLRACLPRTARPRHYLALGLAVLALVGANTYVNSTTFAREDLRPLARLLQAREVTAVYGDYWTVIPLTYDSDESIVGVATGDDLSKGRNNRYSPYLRAAATSAHYAWVVRTGSARQRSVAACLATLHSRYTQLTWHDQTIYDHPTAHAFPWWNGGRCPTAPSP